MSILFIQPDFHFGSTDLSDQVIAECFPMSIPEKVVATRNVAGICRPQPLLKPIRDVSGNTDGSDRAISAIGRFPFRP